MPRLRVALDVSLRSLGAALAYVTDGSVVREVAVAGFGGKKPAFNVSVGALSVSLLQPPDAKAADVVRYTHITDQLFENFLIPAFSKVADVSTDVEVLLEGYAFVPERAGSTYKLHELTGVIKYRLHALGVFSVHTVASSTWRKRVLGCARADKAAALHHFEQQHPDVDLFTITGKKRGVTVPCPVQDIVEAWCLLYAHGQEETRTKTFPENSPVPKKSRKRRRVNSNPTREACVEVDEPFTNDVVDVV